LRKTLEKNNKKKDSNFLNKNREIQKTNKLYFIHAANIWDMFLKNYLAHMHQILPTLE